MRLKKRTAFWKNIKKTNTLVILLISTFSSLILYKLFFIFSKLIWSFNLKIDINALSPPIRWAVSPGQRDGIEAYVLYALIFVCIVLTILFVWFYDSLRQLHRCRLLILFLFSLILGACFYYLKIGFYPPVTNRSVGLTFLIPASIIMLILWLLIRVASWKEIVASLLIILFLIPICFIATSPISLLDYSYIFAPALRLINHFQIIDIYFQYDLLLSLIAALWMKLKIDLNLFQILGQVSFYGLFLVSFFFSKRFFYKKQLAYYLLIALVLLKIYANISDPITFFQVTPLRLDWWLLILILSFSKGIYNKLVGIFLGLLIVFHRTFGLIYTIGYLEVIAVLFLLDFWGSKISLKFLNIKIKKHFLFIFPNLIFLMVSYVVSLIIFGKASLEAASIYQKIGIGFMPISPTSFYWYFFVLVSVTTVILIKKKNSLSSNYFNSALFLIALSVGNSIYFFGRSHENNIINISASLIFVLYLFFDLILDFQTNLKRLLSILLPSLFILLITFFYSAGILNRSQIQLNNIYKHQTIYPIPINDITLKISLVKELTNNNDKIYFIGNNDFYYYYYGNYVPLGRYSPYNSWIYKDDVINFTKNLLDKGYYVIFPPCMYDETLFMKLFFDKSITKDGFKVVWNGY